MRKKVIEMIESTIINVMKMGKIPGLSVGIIEEGETEYANGFGARNLEENLPMTADTLFGIGSTTKSFTAISIMQLFEQGKIDLNAPLKDYIEDTSSAVLLNLVQTLCNY